MKIMSIVDCARCGEDHTILEAVPFVRPFAPPAAAPVVWTHWAKCPTNGDPILFQVAEYLTRADDAS